MGIRWGGYQLVEHAENFARIFEGKDGLGCAEFDYANWRNYWGATDFPCRKSHKSCQVPCLDCTNLRRRESTFPGFENKGKHSEVWFDFPFYLHWPSAAE